MSIIFRKTAKGVHEIETREHRLPPRVRNALILVDGNRDVAALQALMPQQIDGTLEMLLQQAFIEVVGRSAAAPSSRAAQEERRPGIAPPAAVPAMAAAPVVSAPAVPFNVRQRAAVRDLNDAVGPMAEMLAIRMERARDETDLRPLVQAASQMIGNTRGRSAADAYAKRHGI